MSEGPMPPVLLSDGPTWDSILCMFASIQEELTSGQFPKSQIALSLLGE